MSRIVKTVVATGATSGLGFEAVKQLLHQSQPYRFILGARDIKRSQAAYDEIKYDAGLHSISFLPLDLSDLSDVKSFAQQTLDRLEKDKIDVLFLNAGMAKGADGPGPHGSQWCEAYVVNHLSQHYLTHLLRNKLVESHSRVVVVSSGAVRNLRENDPATLVTDLKAGSKTDGFVVYRASKFVQLLGAHYWRRQFGSSCDVVAVSPGLIPNTGLGRNSTFKLDMNMPDAKSVEEGASSLLRAFTRDDFPSDPEQIFLTSWGEWWPKDVYATTLDKELQGKWCLSKEEIEKEAGI
ncbi:uncharacterized protein JN550_004485 [Neoarthrinium moseri]|uniref:uncharacterized protein n=1 Tax=Neoarthrinium moseri TaxID=1658444 RepID=UPI001FDC49E8|nr:uncharacterized protein JN550_004485 [Neoarthrinium moseri]KAI1871491.1 hypothetical protein JN550_004485 [Neoarthrinium moseri]